MKKSIPVILIFIFTSINAYSQLIWSTYLGGGAYNAFTSMKIDTLGNSYITGSTSSSSFPVSIGAYQTTINKDFAIFVTKLNSTGTNVIFSTFIGGSGGDIATDIDIDKFGNSYITGECGYGYPTTSGVVNTGFVNEDDSFITKLNSTGTGLIYSTYIGNEEAMFCKIASDVSGYTYFFSTTYSNNFPVTVGAYDTIFEGISDLVLTKLNPNAKSLIFSTFIGGSNSQNGTGLVIDSYGNSYITGTTNSNDFPVTTGVFQTAYDGSGNVFLSKFNSVGNSILYSTYIGGGINMGDYFFNAIDTNKNSYITGNTSSNKFPSTIGSYDRVLNGYINIFLTKLNSSASSLIFSTFIGGSSIDIPFSISLDNKNNSNITGYTYSYNFPLTKNTFDSINHGDDNCDCFISKINYNGSNLIFSSYLGGNGDDFGRDIVIDSLNSIYLTGTTNSNNFPVTSGVFDTSSYSDNFNVFVTKFDLCKGSPSIQTIDTIKFPSLCIGSDKEQDTFYLYNISSSCILLLNSMSLSGTNSSEFSKILPTNLPIYVQPGDSSKIIVQFNPIDTSVIKTATLSIQNNSIQNTILINLIGALKLPKIESDTNLSFHYIECLLESQESIFIKNTGNCDLILKWDTISGKNNSEFIQSSPANLPLTIAAGDSIKYIIQFNPSDTAGIKKAVLQIFNNSSTNPRIINLYASYDSIAFKVNNTESDTIDIDIGKICPGSVIDTAITIFNKSSIGTTIKIDNVDPNLQIISTDKAVKGKGDKPEAVKKKK